MQNRRFGLANSSLIDNPFVQHFDESIIAPGNVKFIATEDLLTITTEDGIGLTTEG